MKTVDSVMREMYHDRHPVKAALDTKWMLKLIEEQVRALLDGKQAAEAKKLHLDYGKLDKIRSDAAVTRDKLIVDEEEDYSGEQEQALSPEPDTAPSAGEAPDIPLTQQECRFLRCLLYGGGLLPQIFHLAADTAANPGQSCQGCHREYDQHRHRNLQSDGAGAHHHL